MNLSLPIYLKPSYGYMLQLPLIYSQAHRQGGASFPLPLVPRVLPILLIFLLLTPKNPEPPLLAQKRKLKKSVCMQEGK